MIAFLQVLYYNKAMEVYYEVERDSLHRDIEILYTEGCGLHFHAQVEILCVVSGSISVTINGEHRSVGKGGVCVSGSYDVHEYSLEQPGSEGIVILIPLDFLQKFFTYTKDSVITKHFIDDEKTSESVIKLVELYEKNSDCTNPLYGDGWVNLLLGLLYDKLEFTQSSVSGKVETIRTVLAYIRSHYDEKLTLSGLSKQFGYNPCHFSRLFNGFTNISLKRYINSVRLEAASGRLKNGESVTDAALNSGFNSMRTFYRDFTEYYGITPQRYTRRFLKSAESSGTHE